MGTLIVLIALTMFLFFLILPVVLTSYMNTAKVAFSNVDMSDHVRMSSRSDDGASVIHHANSTLRMYASCRLEGLSLPVDVGIVVDSLDVSHGGEMVGKLVPEETEISVLRVNNGNFSLPASLNILNMTSFHNFASELLQKNTMSWMMSTSSRGASIRIRLPLWWSSSSPSSSSSSSSSWYFDLYVPGVKFQKNILMKGCGEVFFFVFVCRFFFEQK